MSQLSGFSQDKERRFPNCRIFLPGMMPRSLFALAVFLCATLTRAEEPTTSSTSSISREVKDIFEKAAKAVVKIRGTDAYGELSGTGFFIDAAGAIYTAFSVGGDTDNITVEFDGKKYPAHVLLADLRSGIAILKIELATPSLPIGKSQQIEVATPVITIGYPLDLAETPSFGMIAGFDRKFLGNYLNTTHLRVNLPTQRGEAGAPLLNFKGEVVGILVASIDNGSACYALPIDAAEKIHHDFIRFGEARHGWIGIKVATAEKPVESSTTEMTEMMADTPAFSCGIKAGDILLQVGNVKVHEPEDVIDASFFLTAGDTVPIIVSRGGEKLTFEITAGRHPASLYAPKAATLTPHDGIPLQLDFTRRTP